MANLFLQENLIIKLNELSQIPLPLAKYTQLKQWILYIQHLPNQYCHPTIRKYFAHEGITIDHREIIATLQYMFKSGKKSGLTAKQINTLLNENTMLSSDHSNFLIQLYESYLSNDGSSQIMGNSFRDLKWSAINLKQTQQSQQPNKLYMKVEVIADNVWEQKRKTMNMTLLQFKLLLEETNKIQSLVSV